MSVYSSASIRNITQEECEEWMSNKLRNPRTGRTIKENGPTYLAFVNECTGPDDHEKILDCINQGRFCPELLENPQADLLGAPSIIHHILKSRTLTETRRVNWIRKFDMVARAQFGQQERDRYYIQKEKNQSIVDMLLDVTTNRAEASKVLFAEILSPETIVWLNTDVPNKNLLVELITHKHIPSVIAIARRKVPLEQNVYNAALLWAGIELSADCFEALVDAGADPNYQAPDSASALLYYMLKMTNKPSLTDQQAASDFKRFLDYGASKYTVYLKQNTLSLIPIRTNDLVGFYTIGSTKEMMNKLGAYPYINADLQTMHRNNLQLTSDEFYVVCVHALNTVDLQDWPPEPVIKDLLRKSYLYTGRKIKPTNGMMDPVLDIKPEDWTSEEHLSQLQVRIVPVGDYENTYTSTKWKKRKVYDILLYHTGQQQYVGCIGNFIKMLPSHVHGASFKDLADHGLLASMLQKLHDRRKLLLNVFPYKSGLQLFMFDERVMDDLKLGSPRANQAEAFRSLNNPMAYMELLHSVQVALDGKKRFIPHEATNMVHQAFSSRFIDTMKSHGEGYQDVTLAKNIVETFQRNSPRSSSSVATQGRQSITSQSAPSSEHRRRTAAKTITRFGKRRVENLKRYFEESIQYMNNLPLAKRKTIYRALTGNLMQGPASPIRRVNNLLYVKDTNLLDIITMMEVVASAPRLPLRYSLYRGMYMDPPPVIGSTVIYQEIPFSTTFLSMYSIGWTLAKKGAPCCLFELRCHRSTSGLFLSKLPWMDPWTSANSAIFNRIAPRNTTSRFHIKVNAQNEFLMAPYALRVVGERKKVFRSLLEEQIEKLDSHYEYDASQRNLNSLLKTRPDLLDQEITVYIVDLEPISMWIVHHGGKNVPLQAREAFVPGAIVNGAPMNTKIALDHQAIIFSPEEHPPEVAARIEALAAKHKVTIHKLMEKGRYLGLNPAATTASATITASTATAK